MKFIYSFLFLFQIESSDFFCKKDAKRAKRFRRESEKTLRLNVLSWIFLSLIVSGCGGGSKECIYYDKLKKGNTKGATAEGNQAISAVQDKIIACAFDKSCRDIAIENFGKTHKCNQ